MGEYIKHPDAIQEEEIKIAVFRGTEVSTWFSKEILQEFLRLGYGDYYGGFGGDSKTLEILIERYQEADTSFMKYKDLLIVQPEPNNKEVIAELKEHILSENVGFPLWDGEKMNLVIAEQYMTAVRRFADEKGWFLVMKKYPLPNLTSE